MPPVNATAPEWRRGPLLVVTTNPAPGRGSGPATVVCGLGGAPEPLDRQLADAEAVQLSGGGGGHLVEHEDVARALVSGQTLAAPGDEVLGADDGARRQDDAGDRLVQALLVRDRDHHDLID